MAQTFSGLDFRRGNEATAPSVAALTSVERSVADAIPVCFGLSGTSRIAVFGGDGVDQDHAEGLMMAIATGSTALMTGGNAHYQDRKFAVVWRSQTRHHFFFRFYQYSAVDRTLISNLECGNAAALCGAFALMHQLAELNLDGSLIAENLGTGQRIRLSPNSSTALPSGPWEVRFVQEDFSFPWIECQDLVLEDPRSDKAACILLERGNSFLFAETDPYSANAEAAARLKAAAEPLRQGDGLGRYHPKVVFYRTEAIEDDGVRLRAACWFDGERHRSLPGSAAMSLCGFLTLAALATDPPPADAGTFRFKIDTPSVELEIRVDWIAGPFGYQVQETGFCTPTVVHFVGSMLSGEAEC
jgi:hypothetical protein